jgi:hypothetical protein
MVEAVADDLVKGGRPFVIGADPHEAERLMADAVREAMKHPPHTEVCE